MTPEEIRLACLRHSLEMLGQSMSTQDVVTRAAAFAAFVEHGETIEITIPVGKTVVLRPAS